MVDPRFRRRDAHFAQQRERATLDAWRSAGQASLAGLRVLEVGCGRGERLADLLRWGAQAGDLFGVDMMPAFLEEARKNHPALGFSLADASRLPFPDASFDAVMQFTLFSSILDERLRRAIATEMLRVARPGGVLLWYDMRYPNPWNPDVRPIGRAELGGLFPGIDWRVRSATLLPPLARALAPVSFALCRALEALPPLRSHYLAIGRKSR